MSLKKLMIILLLLSFSALFATQDFPKVHQSLLTVKDTPWIKKIVLNKNKTRLLVMSRNLLELRDAKTLKIIKDVEFEGSAWDCDFVENGFVLLTHHDFTYFNSTGTKVLYRVNRRDARQIKKIDVQNNQYIVNMIKEIEGRGEGVISFNLRTKKYVQTHYKSNYIKKHYLRDINKNIVKIELGNHVYKYIDIISAKDVNSSSLKTLEHNEKKVLKAEDARFYASSYESSELGCISPNGKRYATFPRKGTLKVYDVGKKEPIFTLPYIDDSYSQRDCLIYDDTLVVQDKTLQAYDLKKDKSLYANIDSSVKVMPIVGSCLDKDYGLSLWVSTMYGWNLKKGEMRWYSNEPELNRNHWEIASYLIEMVTHEKWALVKPFGERGFGKELNVSLVNGRHNKWQDKLAFKLRGKSKVCDPGLDRGNPGAKNSFTHLNLEFYALNKGDWLVISPKDGYFNTSSKRVLSILAKNHASLSTQDIQKWYRPDIIEAKLAKKSFEKLKDKETNFTLAKTSNLENQYTNTIFTQILEDKNYKNIGRYMKKASIDEIKELYKVVQKNDTSEAYFRFYSALQGNKAIRIYRKYRGKKKMTKKYKEKILEYEIFIDNNVKNLSTDTKEKPELIRFLANIKQYELLKEISSKSKLNLESKKALASSYKISKEYQDVFWEVWDKQNYIRRLGHMEFLYKKNPKRAKVLAEKTLIYLLKNNKRECTKFEKNRFNILCQSDFDVDRYGNLVQQIESLYIFLIKHPLDKTPKELKRVSYDKLSTNLNKNYQSYFGENKMLIEFYIKYATKKEMGRLKNLTRNYLKRAIFKTNWNGQTWGDGLLSKKRIMIGTVMKSMIEVDSEYIMDLQLKIIHSTNIEMYEALSSEIVNYKNLTSEYKR